ncbi:signal-regulatory protein beta-1-like isoform X3 [Polypterus senegalus]|uniref:signal-regulatory protein beta-1-like isoform X3 n=1 Tax=Polypterus senegalus TaxID=55291 RepID=UPI001964EEF7|nr:signal-regulatory protein beta-1-like isoform X3 [Polypterus senegalus]
MVFLSLESLHVFLLLMFQQQVTGQPQYYVEATEESNVTLTCVISRAFPPSSMTWYKAIGGECTHVYSFPPMDEGNDPRVTWTEDTSLLNFSITIRDVKVNDTGEYFCEMHTKLLWDMHCMYGRRITLTVRGFW